MNKTPGLEKIGEFTAHKNLIHDEHELAKEAISLATKLNPRVNLENRVTFVNRPLQNTELYEG